MNIWKISSQGAHRHNGWPFNKFSGLWLALGRASLFQAFSIGQTIPSSFWECGSNPTFMQANEFLEWLSTEYSVHSYFCGLDGSIRLFSFECFFFNFIFDYWVHSLHFHLMWKFYSVFVEKKLYIFRNPHRHWGFIRSSMKIYYYTWWDWMEKDRLLE